MTDLLRYCVHCVDLPYGAMTLDDEGRCPSCHRISTQAQLEVRDAELEAYAKRNRDRVIAEFRKGKERK